MDLLVTAMVASPFTAAIPAFYALYLLFKRKLNIYLNYWSIGLLALFTWSFIVGLINKDILSTVSSLLLFGYFLMYQLTYNYLTDRRKIHYVLERIADLTVIASVIGIIEKVVFLLIGNDKHRVYSLFGNPNMTGCWFAISMFIFFYLSSIGTERYRVKNNPIKLGLIVTALLLTGSRGAYIGCSTALVLYVFIRGFNKYKKRIIIGTIGSLSLISLFLVTSDIAKKYISAHPFIDSLSPRMKVWDGAFGMIVSKPIHGWGLTATLTKGKELLPLYKLNTIHVHNLWLGLLAATGIVGLAIYLYMKFRLFKDMKYIFSAERKLTLLFICINTIIIVQGTVDIPLYAPQIGIIFVSIGAIVDRIKNQKRQVEYFDRQVKKNPRNIA